MTRLSLACFHILHIYHDTCILHGTVTLIYKELVSHTESEYMNGSLERDLCISQCFCVTDHCEGTKTTMLLI